MTAFAIEASAEYGHESDDVLCKLFFESLSGLVLKNADSGMRFTAQQSNKGSALNAAGGLHRRRKACELCLEEFDSKDS